MRLPIGPAKRSLRRAGVEAGSADHLYSEALYLVDPDGLTVEVYADRPREEWIYENGELMTGVEPLRLSELLALEPRRGWVGAPAGTTVGHVHFFIGDLERAADFYCGGLGMDKKTWSFPGALFVSAGGYHHHAGLNTWAAGSPVASRNDPRLLFWELSGPERRGSGRCACEPRCPWVSGDAGSGEVRRCRSVGDYGVAGRGRPFPINGVTLDLCKRDRAAGLCWPGRRM